MIYLTCVLFVLCHGSKSLSFLTRGQVGLYCSPGFIFTVISIEQRLYFPKRLEKYNNLQLIAPKVQNNV